MENSKHNPSCMCCADLLLRILSAAREPTWTKDIAVRAGISLRSAQRYLRILTELGYLEQTKRKCTFYYQTTDKVKEMLTAVYEPNG